jgi:hypothetical protein
VEENNKRTAVYLVVAALAVVLAFEPWSRRHATGPVEESGKLFPDFSDPLAAASMRIVKYDDETGTLHPFQVSQAGGRWSIPSHQNYPADARDHLADAATALIDLEIRGVAGDSQAQHELFGVLDPDSKTVAAGATGVGTRVTMKDAKDNVLADVIVGKEVKDDPKLRYVRKPARDRVYTVAVKTDKLSTKFGDWIEKDLLKLNAFDVRGVVLADYSTSAVVTLDRRLAVAPQERSEIVLGYDDAKAAWTLDSLIEFENDKPVRGELKPDEELNTEKLNAMKTALDDLQIVDVQRKPKGMKGLALTEDIVTHPELVQSLQMHGFYPAITPDQTIEIYSSEGEAICRMKDGVEYVLRFGRIAGTGDEKSADEKSAAEKSADEKDPGAAAAKTGVNRFLFVSARFNQDLVPKPSLEGVPTEEQAGPAAADKPAADKPEAAKKDDKAPAEAKDASKLDEAKPDEAKAADAQAAEEDAAERKKQLAEKQAAVEKENQRKQTEYEEKVKKGQDHVKELNSRFADWYYVIADDTYRKIHLGRGDVIKTKEKKADEAAADPAAPKSPPPAIPKISQPVAPKSQPAPVPKTQPAAPKAPAKK